MNHNRKNIILVGGGGHCKSCIEVVESTGLYHITGILDLPDEAGKKILKYEVIGNDNDIEKFHKEGHCFIISTGQIKSATLRKKLFEKLIKLNVEIETIVASSARVSEYAKIGRGTIVMHHTLINAGTEIGENCIVNSGAIIEHDVKVGDHSHISTNAVINGDSIIGSETFIGSGTSVSNGIIIGSRAVIGAGSLVITNIEQEGVFAGCPASKIMS